MYHHIHTPVLQELMGTLAHIFQICRAGSDDVNHAENATLLGRMIVVVVVMVMGV
jgi:hypothetical protein